MRKRLAAFVSTVPPGGPASAGTGVFWILAATASGFLLIGWLLPWFVGPYDAGVGFSAQDALVSPPTGVGTVLIYVLAVAMVVLLLSPLAEVLMRLRGRPFGSRADRIRLYVELAGVVLTGIVWLLYRVIQEEPLFGSVVPGEISDSAIWLTMYGFALAALVYGARKWVVARQTLGSGPPCFPSASSCR